MTESFEIHTIIPMDKTSLYEAWLDSKLHSLFTGGEAVIDPVEGGEFTAWDGYIRGTTIKTEASSRIVQSWRTTEFSEEHPDSRLELLFEDANNGTRLTLKHSNIPEGQGGSYKQGWTDHYFDPMKEYFESIK